MYSIRGFGVQTEDIAPEFGRATDPLLQYAVEGHKH